MSAGFSPPGGGPQEAGAVESGVRQLDIAGTVPLSVVTILHFFRYKIPAILIAAIVLVGYAESVFRCCDDVKPAAVCHSEDSGAGDHVCQCLCHQFFLNERIGSPAVIGRSVEPVLVFAELADIPPDPIPLGIDHPPQLA